MAWFPLMLDTNRLHCLVLGGGAVSLRKVNALLSFDLHPVVIAKSFCGQWDALPVQCIQRAALPEDADGFDLVIDGTGDPVLGKELFSYCEEHHILLNVVDAPDLCTVIFPSILQRGKFTAALSTSGASPTAAMWAREQLNDLLPDFWAPLLDQLAAVRPLAQKYLPDARDRKKFLQDCFYRALKAERPFTDAEFSALQEELKQQ